MPFALDNAPELSEIAEAINYLLANYVGNVSADPNTGQIVGPQGIVVSYLYRYLAVKYADSFDGSLNFSDSPTNRAYYGLSNSNSAVESTNPADYIWYKVAGGFGTSKFLFYQTIGGRSINFVVATSAPDSTFLSAPSTAIDLDIVTVAAQANSATTAYLVQNQSDPAPSGFPQYTSGNSLPSGWSANLGTVSVGQVAWYTFGVYNGASVTVNGIPANTTYWSTPVAASVFQDIRSDNWNGSNPPNSASVGTWGTQGYYISRTDGNMYANGFYARGVMQVNGAVYNPSLGYTTAIDVNASGGSSIGVTGYTSAAGGFGVVGWTQNGSAYAGVNGTSTSSGAPGVQANNTGGGFGLDVAGMMRINNNTVVTNLNADLLDGQHASAFLSSTGTAANSSALGGLPPSSYVHVASGTSDGSYIYYVNNTGTPSNPTTPAAWILISTNSGATVYIPGYL